MPPLTHDVAPPAADRNHHTGLLPGAVVAEASLGAPVQLGLDEVGTPLSQVPFVVVDLETTGGSAREHAITEIGAVRVRGGEVLGELATLVDPGSAIPPAITVLTGITDAMVVGAPRIEEVLPSFLEFARGAVLVAHNARFDVGFLRAAAARMDLAWPNPIVVDTVQLSRRVVTKDEAPNHKLASLARLFGSAVTPDHRALTDARATVEVLHGLLARMAPLGVTHLEDLRTASDPVPAARRRKATLADGLPPAPGVYQFLGPGGQVLYVGTATHLRNRVRSYFTAAERRRRIGEMLTIAESVRPIVCASPLEAQVRELRLIAKHRPPYNRRSRSPEREPWLRLTDEPVPRLSIVRSVPLVWDKALGPFRSTAAARLAMEAIHGAIPVRRCGGRLPAVPKSGAVACSLAELGHCGAPCAELHAVRDYAGVVERLTAVLHGDGAELVRSARARIARLSGEQRFEEAASERDRIEAYLRAAARRARIAPLARSAHLIAARRRSAGGWEIVLVRHGRLAGVGIAQRGVDPMPVVSSVLATGEVVPKPTRWCGAATSEETELLAKWFEQPGVRIIDDEASTPWAWPTFGAADALANLPQALVASHGGTGCAIAHESETVIA